MSLDSKKILMLLGPQYQDAEAEEPLKYLRSRGATVDVVGLEKGMLKGMHGDAEIEVTMTLHEPRVDDYDALVIPGGRSPANLRNYPEAVSLVKTFSYTGRPIAAICHGPQMLAAARLLNNRTITGYSKIEDEMRAVGANWVDEPVAKDGELITSRDVGDIPFFNDAIDEALS